MSTDSVYFRKSIHAFKKHRSFVWIYSQLQIHTMLYVVCQVKLRIQALINILFTELLILSLTPLHSQYRPFQMRAWSCITSYPLWSLPYLAYDNMNPAMVISMMLRSSMLAFEKVYCESKKTQPRLSPFCPDLKRYLTETQINSHGRSEKQFGSAEGGAKP